MQPYLDRGEYWDGISDAQRMASYNGMGAEWMSEGSRKILDAAFSVLDDAVRVHDVDFCFAPKTKDAWHKANFRFKTNCLLLANNEIPWWRWFKRRRFIRIWIPLLYKCVESDGGWRAFQEAKPPLVNT